MRRLAALVAVALAAVACTDADDVSVEHVDTDHALSGPIVAIGDRLVGSEMFGTSYSILESDDGRRWRSVQLPADDVTESVELRWPERTGDAVVVTSGGMIGPTAGVPLPPAYAWVTDDGQHWRGGKLAERAWGGPPAVRDAGGLLVAGAVSDGRFRVWRLEGDDWIEAAVQPDLPMPDGVDARLEWAWRAADGWRLVVGESTGGSWVQHQLQSEDGRAWRSSPCAEGCVNVLQAPGLVVAQHEASTDGGRSWRRIRTPLGSHEPWFNGLLADPDGGWLLANRTDWEVGPRAGLLRSDDGFVWEQVRTPTCDPDDGRSPDFEGFLNVQDRILVAWSCGDEHSTARRQLLAVDGDRTEVVAELPASLGDVFVHRGRLVAPRYGQDGRLQGFDVVSLG